MSSGLPVVAVVGRPNVGKSSLVNRILGERAAIVQETPGVTRDRRAFEASWAGEAFELVDTGGLEPGARGLDARIAEQAQIAMEAADVILLVVDATVGATDADVEVARKLRGWKKPVVVVVNKVDRPDPAVAAAFFELGLGEPLPVSALHGTGSGDLLDAVVGLLPPERGGGTGDWAAVALVGRPNVGKSSLVNRLLRQERSIVDATPGTTRDPIDSLLELKDGRVLRLVDTAGMRREVQIKDPVEYFSFLRSRGTLARVDAAILVIDASEGVTAHDQRIANEIEAAGAACVIALNKWDLVGGAGPDRDRFDKAVERALRFLPWASRVRTSALTGRAVDKLIPATEEAVEAHRRRMPTAILNRVVREAQAERPHPRSAGRALRILYAVQARVAPPTILLFANGRLETGYLRYIERRIRSEDPFAGTPLRLEVRVKQRT